MSRQRQARETPGVRCKTGVGTWSVRTLRTSRPRVSEGFVLRAGDQVSPGDRHAVERFSHRRARGAARSWVGALWALLFWVGLGACTVAGAQVLKVYPNSWNVIGLDSNNQSVGPNVFLVGTRVCNEAGSGGPAALNLSAQYVGNYIYDAPAISLIGLNTLTLPSLPSGGPPPSPYSSTGRPANCYDFYFNGAILRSSTSFSDLGQSSYPLRKTEPYYIQVSASNAGTVRTPNTLDGTGLRELYVEKLVSQNRNDVTSFTRVDSGGNPVNTPVVVGKTYTYRFVGKTATNGYEQLEHFPYFPNNLFQIQSIATTYSTSGLSLNSVAYADACGWVNDPTDTVAPKYLECVGTGKAGGDVDSLYTVTLLGPGNGTIRNLIYDYSGSSYHYNDDFNDNTGAPLTYSAVLPPSLTVSKTTSTPTLTRTGSALTASYTLSVRNSSAANIGTASGVLIQDTLSDIASGVTLSGTPTITLLGGATRPTVSTPASGSSAPVWGSFTLPAGAEVRIAFNVSIPGSVAVGTYQNGATVTYTDPDGLPGSGAAYVASSSTAEDVTLVASGTPNADLRVLKTASRTAQIAGGALTYTVSVTNLGPGSPSGVAVSDVLPAGLILDLPANPPSATQGSYNTSSGIWTVGSLALNASATLTLAVKVSQTASGSILNTASLSASSLPDPVSSNNSQSVALIANPIALEKRSLNLGLSVPGTLPDYSTLDTLPIVLKPLEYLLYCLRANNAYSTAIAVNFSDTLPSPLSVSNTVASARLNGSPVTVTLSGRTLSLPGVTVAAGSSQTLCFVAQVP